MHNTIFPKYRSPINKTIKGYQKMYIHTHAYTDIHRQTHTHARTYTYTRRHVQTYGKRETNGGASFLQFSIFSTTPRERVKESVYVEEREREREIPCSFDYYKRFQSNICYRSAYWYRNDRLLLLYKARRKIEKLHATNRFNAGDVWSSQKRSDLRRARVWPRPRTK